MKEKLDSYDLNILTILQEEGRITNAELARRVGLSPPSVLQRVRKLEEREFIQGYTAILNEQALGFNFTVLTMVSLSLHQGPPIESFVNQVMELEEVQACFHVSGDYDFLLKVVAKDMEAYENFIREKLGVITGVAKIQSSFVLATKKDTRDLPLN